MAKEGNEFGSQDVWGDGITREQVQEATERLEGTPLDGITILDTPREIEGSNDPLDPRDIPGAQFGEDALLEGKLRSRSLGDAEIVSDIEFPPDTDPVLGSFELSQHRFPHLDRLTRIVQGSPLVDVTTTPGASPQSEQVPQAGGDIDLSPFTASSLSGATQIMRGAPLQAAVSIPGAAPMGEETIDVGEVDESVLGHRNNSGALNGGSVTPGAMEMLDGVGDQFNVGNYLKREPGNDRPSL